MIINNKTPVGEVRPSQLLWTYGPGALIDLPSLSVVTLGIDRWEKDRCQPIQEARLLAAVRKVLGGQVENLRMPPFQKESLFTVFGVMVLTDLICGKLMEIATELGGGAVGLAQYQNS